MAVQECERCSFGAGGGDEVVVVPWPALWRHRIAHRVADSDRFRWWVLITVLAGSFAVNFTFTVFAVALPRTARELGSTENTLTWVITAPMLAYGVAAPALGRAGDVWGHKRVYVIGLAGALVCAALSAVAWNGGSLIAARTLGGLEGAATGSASMALIFKVFHRDDRVKAMGWWSLVGAGGPVIGVVIGGIVIERVGWRWIFVGQMPLIAASLVLAILLLPDTERVTRGSIDWLGAGTLALGVTSLLFAVNRGAEWGWSHPAVTGGFVIAPLAIAAFVAAERRASEPLLPLEFLRRRNFAFPIAASTLSQFAYMGGFILAPSLLSRVFGYGEARIGLMVIARPLLFSVTAPIAGYLAVKTGERSAAVTGTLAVVASMAAFASLDRGSSAIAIVAALGLSGIGLGISSPSLASSVGNAVDEHALGVASAAQQLMVQVGVVVGIQLIKTMQTAGEASRGLVPSFHDAYWLGAAVCMLGVVCAAFVKSAERERGADAAMEDVPAHA